MRILLTIPVDYTGQQGFLCCGLTKRTPVIVIKIDNLYVTLSTKPDEILNTISTLLKEREDCSEEQRKETLNSLSTIFEKTYKKQDLTENKKE